MINPEHINSMMEQYLAEHQADRDNLHVHGFIYVRTFDPTTDETKEERFTPNLITNGGFGKYLENTLGALVTTLRGTWMQIGTAATSLAGTDTALQGSVSTQAGTFSHTATTAQGTVTTIFQPGVPAAAAAIVEMGLFDSNNAGTMLCRGTFAVVNKGTADSFQATYIHSLS